MVTTIGMRDFRAHLSEYIRQVKNGQSLIITEHGKPVGCFGPMEMSRDECDKMLRGAGLIEWNGQKLRDLKPTAINRGDKLASDIVVELRD